MLGGERPALVHGRAPDGGNDEKMRGAVDIHPEEASLGGKVHPVRTGRGKNERIYRIPTAFLPNRQVNEKKKKPPHHEEKDPPKDSTSIERGQKV